MKNDSNILQKVKYTIIGNPLYLSDRNTFSEIFLAIYSAWIGLDSAPFSTYYYGHWNNF